MQVVGTSLLIELNEPIHLLAGATVVGLVTLLGCLWVLGDADPMTAGELGLAGRSPGQSLAFGLRGALLAYPCVLLYILLTSSERSAEKVHGLLKGLQQSPNIGLVLLTIAVAVVLAPLLEDLIFRVVLQGTLRNWLGPLPAILVSAVIFASMHGWPDAAPLIPLALVLGWMYEKTQDYGTIVVLHATFNAFNVGITMLTDPEAIEELQKTLQSSIG